MHLSTNAESMGFPTWKVTSACFSLCNSSSHPVRMPIDEFSSLGFLPMPRLDLTREHYKPFDEVYGPLPDERDRPSNHSSDEGKEIDKAGKEIGVVFFDLSKAFNSVTHRRLITKLEAIGLNAYLIKNYLAECSLSCY